MMVSVVMVSVCVVVMVSVCVVMMVRVYDDDGERV